MRGSTSYQQPSTVSGEAHASLESQQLSWQGIQETRPSGSSTLRTRHAVRPILHQGIIRYCASSKSREHAALRSVTSEDECRRAANALARQPHGLPPLAAREPSAEPRHPHGRGDPDPAPSQRGPGLLRPQDRRRQDPQGSPPRPQATRQRRALRPTPPRRTTLSQGGRQGPGRATRERLCRLRGRLTPRHSGSSA